MIVVGEITKSTLTQAQRNIYGKTTIGSFFVFVIHIHRSIPHGFYHAIKTYFCVIRCALQSKLGCSYSSDSLQLNGFV